MIVVALSTSLFATNSTAQVQFQGKPSERVVRSPEMKLEFQRAERAWRSGASLAEAKTRLDRVLREIPEDREARRLRARVLLDLGRYADAAGDAVQVTDLAPEDGHAWLLLSEARVRDGDLDGGASAFERASALITDGVDEHLRLSLVAQDLGQIDRAETFARVALALGPARPASYRRLAHVFMIQGREDDAVTLLVRGLDDGVVPPRLIPDDEVLAPLASRPAIRTRL